LRAVSKNFVPFAIIYSDMLVSILNGTDIKDAIEEAASKLGY
jgi:ribosomal protein L12E/L44/L45/RPP1/RPP2